MNAPRRLALPRCIALLAGCAALFGAVDALACGAPGDPNHWVNEYEASAQLPSCVTLSEEIYGEQYGARRDDEVGGLVLSSQCDRAVVIEHASCAGQASCRQTVIYPVAEGDSFHVVEVREDVACAEPGAEAIADILAAALTPLLADPALYINHRGAG